ncbi:phage tail protein [Salipaludibacillus agaradhaerens]|uniref:phage tail spike protein n=1 Tax=Salipaludibacillus agaradhaerens TaxID=76935 RepID=UPI0021514A84|nr:phage tail spike protein [Salipaludibacillus agaradhaerens]MCR6105995.1 phage tail protein [Salipaludibacillus agaradhaerens]MCR6118028.1 phage tail protein [Salipaludibacillus agaradhaerens]
MSQIHITDGQTDQILDVIAAEYILTNKHYKSLKDTLETFHFETFADMSFSNYLGKLHNIIIPDEDGKYIEFVIFETNKYRNEDGVLITEVYSSASHQLLKKSKVIEPQVLLGQTPSQAVAFALYNTEWQPGVITYKGTKEFEVNDYTNPYSFLKRVANEFDIELQFRVEVNGNKVTGRFVDLVPQVGEWQGREIEFGKDLRGVRRTEEMDGVVTALIGLGPVREDGTRLEALVEDREALERWGRNGQHLIETYEPEATNEDMTLARLTELTQNELQNRVNAVVEYQCDIADLESFPDMANKKIRCGDTIKIKDTKFNPPLYLEARVHTQERDIIDQSKKTIELGDFIEYTEAEVMDIWRSLQKQINFKIGQNQLADYTYDKAVIDDKDSSIYSDSKSYAFTKAQEAEDNAKEHADIEYAPIRNEVEENKSVWNRSGIINEDGTLNTDRLFGELTDDQIKSAGIWNAQGTFIDSNGVYTGVVVAEQLVANSLSAISANLGDVTAGRIRGVSIESSKFSSLWMDSNDGSSKLLELDNANILFEHRGKDTILYATLDISPDGIDHWSSYSYSKPFTIKSFEINLNSSHRTKVSSDLNVQGKVNVLKGIRSYSSGGALELQSSSTGEDAAVHINFLENNENRLGYIGFGSRNNSDLYLSNETGGLIRLYGDVTAYNDFTFKGNVNLTNWWYFTDLGDNGLDLTTGGTGFSGNNRNRFRIGRADSNVFVQVRGNFAVSGSKSALVETDSYGERLMYALETPDSRFVAYTEHVLEEGEHFIEIEPMFLETISPTDYFVVPHIQNAAEVVILERKEGKFRVWVQGHTAEVVFEINGKRRGYEDIYMEAPSFDDEEEEA